MLRKYFITGMILAVAFAAEFVVEHHTMKPAEQVLCNEAKASESHTPAALPPPDTDIYKPSKPLGVAENIPPEPSVKSDCILEIAKSLGIEAETLMKDTDILVHPESYDTEDILHALRRIGGYADISNLIHHQDSEVRVAAIQAISDRKFADLLIAASQDQNADVREAAVEKMSEIENDDENSLFKERFETLLSSEKDEDIVRTLLNYLDRQSADSDEFLSITYGFLQRDDISPESLIYYAELLSEYQPTATAFESLLSSPSFQNATPETKQSVWKMMSVSQL